MNLKHIAGKLHVPLSHKDHHPVARWWRAARHWRGRVQRALLRWPGAFPLP